MSDVDEHDDYLDPLSCWIRRHPETWHDAMPPLGAGQIDRTADRVIGRAKLLQRRAAARRRRRRIVAAGAVTGVLVVGGAVGVAAMLRGQPSQPTAGVACQDGVGDDVVVVAIDATDDPIGGCEEAWRSGQFNADRDHSPEPPPFVACIGPGGAVQVHPVEFGTCQDLGLTVAEGELDRENRAIVDLNDRLVEVVNSAEPCMGAREAAAAAEEILGQSALKGWRVETRAGAVGASCAKAAVEADRKLIIIFRFP